MEYGWFTKLCEFQMCSKMNQLYTYIYIYPPWGILVPLWIITEYWIKFPVVCGRSLLGTYFTYNCMYMSILISQFISLPLSSPGNHKFAFYICDSISVFQISSLVSLFLDFTYKLYHMIFVFLCLTYFTPFDHL